MVAVASLGVATGAWILLCLKFNGYVLAWPDIPAAVGDIEQVRSVTPLEGWIDNELQARLVIDPQIEQDGVDDWLQDHLDWGRRTYDSPWYRVAISLDKRSALSEAVKVLDSEIANKVDEGFRASVDIASSTNQPARPMMRAVVFEATDSHNQPITVITARGSGNGDTYPYYEAVFRSDAAGIAPGNLIASQRFNYDVAGIEGLEPTIQIIVLIYLLLLALTLTTILYWFRYLLLARRYRLQPDMDGD